MSDAMEKGAYRIDLSGDVLTLQLRADPRLLRILYDKLNSDLLDAHQLMIGGFLIRTELPVMLSSGADHGDKASE